MTAMYSLYGVRQSKVMALAVLTLVVIMTVGFIGCTSDKSDTQVSYVTEGYRGYVSSSSKVNMRSGPSKSSSKITTLSPGDRVMVYANNMPGSSWLYIKAPNGQSGYVASRLLTYNTSDVVTKAVNQPKVANQPKVSGNRKNFSSGNRYKHKSSGKIFTSSVPEICVLSAKAYSGLMRMSQMMAWLTMIGAILVEFGLIFALSYYYKETYSPSPVWIWVTLVISVILTVPTIVMFFSIGDRASAYGYTMYTLMLLSTGCLMLHAAWRVKQYGMDGGVRRNSHAGYYEFGLFLGEVLWLAVMVPMIGVWWEVVWHSDMYFWMFPNNWISLVIGCFLAMLLPIVLCNVSRFLCGLLFFIANQSIYYILCYVVSIGVCVMLARFTWVHFSGWWLVLPFAICIMSAIASITERFDIDLKTNRCPNCHSLDVTESGREYHGDYTTSSTGWQDASSSDVIPEHSGAYVSDAKRQYRTVSSWEAWTSQHYCNNCKNQWDVRQDKFVNSSTSYTGRTKHTETW